MEILKQVHRMVWGPWLMLLFLAAGIFWTLRSGAFQLRGFGVWWRATAGSLLLRQSGGADKKTQIKTACTALAATVGTGNIVGVAAAITAGGPGALFWMWVSAGLGMMTAYAEVYLGILSRYRKDGSGEFVCGPYVYLDRLAGNPGLAGVYALLCLLASLSMGSMVQANSLTETVNYSFSFPKAGTAAALGILTALVIRGGRKRIGETAAKLVPLSAGMYVLFSVLVLLRCRESFLPVLREIFQDAFSFRSAAGGAAGWGVSHAVRYGLARGVFSNEAGLGSMAVLHGDAPETVGQEWSAGREPGAGRELGTGQKLGAGRELGAVRELGAGQKTDAGRERDAALQGMWAMFEVFFDTILVCSLTGFSILCGIRTAGGSPGLSGAGLTSWCFSRYLGRAGGIVIPASLMLFAFATIIAWYHLGNQAFDFVRSRFRMRSGRRLYGLLYLSAVAAGCLIPMDAVWLLSDIINGLMALPNLTALFWLAGCVKFPLKINKMQGNQGKSLTSGGFSTYTEKRCLRWEKNTETAGPDSRNGQEKEGTPE